MHFYNKSHERGFQNFSTKKKRVFQKWRRNWQVVSYEQNVVQTNCRQGNGLFGLTQIGSNKRQTNEV
jgi:hypothetical protein